MVSGSFVTIVVGSASGEVILITAAIGFLMRRSVSRYDKIADQVQHLVTHMVISERDTPQLLRRITELEEETGDLDKRVTVIYDRYGQHEHWHERHA